MDVTATGWLYVGLLGLSAAVTFALGVYAFGQREEPGALGFAGMMGAEALWAGVYALALLAHDPATRGLLQDVQWLGTCVYLWLLLFAFEYTGNDRFATRRVLGVLSLPWLASVALNWTEGAHDLWWSTTVTEVHGLAILEFSYGPAFLMHTLYSYVVIVLAAALLFRLVFVSDYLYADQSALLVFGILAPVLLNVADIVVFEPGALIDVTPIAFAVTGVAFGYALFRHRLFDLVPATRRLGRNAAISQLDTGVVIVDTGSRVVYCNEAAEPVLGCSREDALERDVDDLVDVEELDLDAPDALAEIERDDTTYEVRTSPITDRRDRTIGHTLIAHDVTARKRRERELAAQRDELETVEALNGLIRGVLQALVSEPDREGIERAVCDRIVAGELYRTACVGDVATWTGGADRWTVAGEGSGVDAPSVSDEHLDGPAGETAELDAHLPAVPDRECTWVVVPIVYGRTVYGAIGLATDREHVGKRERSVLAELGEAVGHAINAVETRRLLAAEAVVELDVECTAPDDPLVAATRDQPWSLSLAGVLPGDAGATVAYLRVDGDATAAAAVLDSETAEDVRLIRGDESGGLLEWTVSGDAPLGTMVDHGAHVRDVSAADGVVEYALEVAAEDEGRSLVDGLEARLDSVRLVAKRRRSGPIDEPASLPASSVSDLTDRQAEALEAAYRAGYFEWPRDSTAEDVAASLDISSSTLHSHLRKAEGSLFASLFDATAEGD